METRFGCRLYLLNILHCDKYEMPMSSHPWPCLQRYRYNDGDHRIEMMMILMMMVKMIILKRLHIGHPFLRCGIRLRLQKDYRTRANRTKQSHHMSGRIVRFVRCPFVHLSIRLSIHTHTHTLLSMYPCNKQ